MEGFFLGGGVYRYTLNPTPGQQVPYSYEVGPARGLGVGLRGGFLVD